MEKDTIVYNAIKQLTQARIDARHEPSHVLLATLIKHLHGVMGKQDIIDALNRLYAEGKIKAGKTINDKYIKLI